MTLALTIEARDPNTNGHCERLARHAVRLGRTLGLPGDDLNALHRGGYLHDVGKVGIPDAVLLKPGPLTREEMDLMKKHPEIGDSLCAPLQSLRHVRPIISVTTSGSTAADIPAGLGRRRAAPRADRRHRRRVRRADLAPPVPAARCRPGKRAST